MVRCLGFRRVALATAFFVGGVVCAPSETVGASAAVDGLNAPNAPFAGAVEVVAHPGSRSGRARDDRTLVSTRIPLLPLMLKSSQRAGQLGAFLGELCLMPRSQNLQARGECLSPLVRESQP